MTRSKLSHSFAALLCLAAVPALSQQYTVKNIVFDGKMPYSQDALATASGLKPGDTISTADLQAASQRLIDTGVFADLQSTVDGPTKGISVIFKVKPVDPSHLLTVSFDNIVWYQPEELATEIQKQVPLFNGTVPEGGNEQDAIIGALRKLLAAKGVTGGKISVESVAPSPSQPLRLAEFRLDEPDIRIHSLTLNGVTPQFSAATGKLVQIVTEHRYNEGLVPNSLPSMILSIYKNAGYQASSITSLSRTIASTAGPRVEVDVTATIQEGELYHLSHFDWAGSPMMSAQGFAAEANIHPGDVASQRPILESLGKLEAAYRNKGYMDVVVTAKPQLDTAAHQVAFTVEAIPGEVYKLRSITPVNLNDTQKADFDKTWKLKPGDTYDEGYVASFIKNNSAVQSLAGLTAAFKTVADPDTHQVDLIMTFH